MFLLAHLSDVHLAPLPQPNLRELLGKRLSGYLSWRHNRQTMHSRKVVDLLTRDIVDNRPDHVAITGDLVNIALEEEFIQADTWLRDFGSPDTISFVPGNHDAYVPVPYEKGIGRWQDYMTNNTKNDYHTPCFAGNFPYIRRFNNIALIGVSSAIPTYPFIAGGAIGAEQLSALENILQGLGRQNVCRVIMIHHPPLPGQNSWRKALWDATQFKDILRRQGAELVLHGHNHDHMFQTTAGPAEDIPVYGVPSASMHHKKHKPCSHYYLFKIEKKSDTWCISGTKRGLNENETGFEDCGLLPKA